MVFLVQLFYWDRFAAVIDGNESEYAFGDF